MNDMMILETVERYIRGEMNPDERLHFESLRKTNSEIDQLVVEHTLFLQQMNRFGEWKKFRSTLQNVHIHLAENGKIDSARLKGKAKIVYFWNRYKRVAAIAASIAVITTLAVYTLAWSLNPVSPTRDIQQLKGKYNELENKYQQQNREITNVKNKINTTPIAYKTGGTSFLIDGNGFLITNAHIVENAKRIAVQNTKGINYTAKIIYTDISRDLALLKIEDSTYRPVGTLPYSFNNSSIDLAEPIFTLGFPKNEIVYGEGYLSAKTGFNGDTLTFQIEVAANPGNSGGPVLNNRGEIIGILSTRQKTAEGVVFVTQAKYIFQALNNLKEQNDDPLYQKLKLPAKTSIKGLDRIQQVKKVEDYVFMVKVY